MRTWAQCASRSTAAWAVCLAGLRHFTFSQEEALDHALRAALRSGPTLVSNISRKLPDALLELLSEEDGGLLGYLKRRNQMFLVRQEPGTMRNVASLTAAVAATGYRDGARRAIAQSVEMLSSGHSHIDGVPVAILERSLPPISRQRIYAHSGSALAFYLSCPDVFEVDPQRKTVKLVGPTTPLPPLQGSTSSHAAAESATAAASTPPLSGPATPSTCVPAPPPPSSRAPSSPSALTGAQAMLRCATYNKKLLRVLQCYVPFSHHVTLKSLLAGEAARAALLDAMEGGNRRPGNVERSSSRTTTTTTTTASPAEDRDGNAEINDATLTRLVAELERIPSAMLDCRIFSMDSEGGSGEAVDDEHTSNQTSHHPFDQESCFLRCLLDDDDVHMSTNVANRAMNSYSVSSSASSTPSQRIENDELATERVEDNLRLLPFVLDVLCEHYRVGLGSEDDVVSWLNRLLPPLQTEGLFEAVPPPPISILVGQQLVVARAEASGQQLGPDVTDVRRFLLWLERWPHLFDVNAETFEVMVRTEVFAAWLRVVRRGTRRQSTSGGTQQTLPQPADGGAVPAVANAHEESTTPAEVQSSDRRDPPLTCRARAETDGESLSRRDDDHNDHDIIRCVLEEISSIPGLAARRPSLTCKNTPVPRVLSRLCSEISLRHTPLPLSVANTAIVLGPAWGLREEKELRDAFGSPLVQSFALFVGYHPHIFAVRDPDGLPPEEQNFAARSEHPSTGVAPGSVAGGEGGETLQRTVDGEGSAFEGDGKGRRTSDQDSSCAFLQLWTHKALLHHKKQQSMESAFKYGNKKWTRSVLAQAIYDTLPAVETGDVVIWSLHQQFLVRQYRGIIPPELVLSVAGLPLFRAYAELFVVYEMIVNRPSSFLLARRGVKKPIGCHPTSCYTIEDALKQLAYVTLGGATDIAAFSSLSFDARALVKKHGGVFPLAQRYPQWFDVNVKGRVLTYIGAGDGTVCNSVSHLFPAAAGASLTE